MKVLITGGCGFIGSHTAERFFKEGYEVYIIDNLSTGYKENVVVKHRLYQLNVQDQKCEEVFSNKFDVVVHLAAQIDASKSVQEPYLDAESNILGLVNILNLSGKHKVAKLIFASSAAVYGLSQKPSNSEDDECKPISPYGVSKLAGEYYCQMWQNTYGLDTVCLRFSNVYGPRQSVKGEGGVVAAFMNQILSNQTIKIHGSGEQTRDFIYVEDLVDAIYKCVEFCSRDIINISTNTPCSINNLVEILDELHSPISKEHTAPREGDILHSRLDNRLALQELNWTPLYNFKEGITRTFKWYKKKFLLSVTSEIAAGRESEAGRTPSRIKVLAPYIENILAFFVVLFLSEFSRKNGIAQTIDFKLIYIIIFGIIYGLRQASIASFLSCTLFIWDIREMGRDMVSLMYNVNTLIHFSLYIFIGAILGYAIDRKKYLISSKEEELEEIKEKFDFLYRMYDESKIVRKELQDQIINTEDSFGKIYKITSVLDTLEPEKVFGQTVGVIEEIMKTKDVCIFSVSQNQSFLRLISKSKDSKIGVNKSIRVSDFPEIENVINNKTLYINKELKASLPLMMVPIAVEGKVLALVAIYKLDFETMSLYKQNLLMVVANLITSALARAYQYNQAIYDEKYLKGTAVLKDKYFKQLLESKIEAKEKNNTDLVLLKICDSHGWENREILPLIEKSIRETDFLGVNEDNQLFLLLSNTRPEEAEYVIRRLINMKILNEGERHVVDYNRAFCA